MSVDTSLPIDELTIRPWPDPVIDLLGHDPRSRYVEAFWLGILGPTTTWLLRRIAAGLDQHPRGYRLDLPETARCLGLGVNGGRHNPFMRSLSRLLQFELAQLQDDDVLAVRAKIPPLNRRQVLQLPATLQAAHTALQEEDLRTPQVEHMRRRGRQLALSLLELGEDIDATERQLLRWKYHPALAREAAAWAWERHRRALAAARAAATPPTGDAA
ncbi:MAG: hypothetical protein LC792_23085 [Actinobacteria bacterium]|nr:hypothetical protein [Actinomycetota bacterium]